MLKLSVLRRGITRLLNFPKNRLSLSSIFQSQAKKSLPIPEFYFNPSNSNPGQENKISLAYPPGTDQEVGDHFLPGDDSLNLLNAYLLALDNIHDDICKLKKILEMPRIIFEIGCGSGEVAYEIALKNPHMGVIATDKYDWSVPDKSGSHYQKVALAWKEKQLKIQEYLPANMVVLRAEADIIRFFPDQCIDSVLLLNPEPKVCEAFLKFIREKSWHDKIKPGPDQILVVPFSREMGVSACSGFECSYTEERPGELSFLNAHHFRFRRGEKHHWGLNLTRASAYSRNSTKNDVYICGNQFQEQALTNWDKMIRKIF